MPADDIAAAQLLGRWLGEHALAVFAGALLVLQLTTVALWAVLGRLAKHPRLGRLPPGAFLALRLGFGFAVVVAGGALFAEAMDALDAHEELGHFDTALAETLRARLSPAVLRAFALITHLGDVATLVALGAAVALALLLRGRRWLALGWVLALAGNGLLTGVLKAVFERARPLHDHGVAAATGFSFPSGHSSGAVVAYGMLGYLLWRHLAPRWRLPVLLAASAIAFGVGCSRVFLQVHYASDVVAGFASGLAWLAVCVGSIEALRAYRRRRSQ
jgi:undecaprenyl-diphosphatase